MILDMLTETDRYAELHPLFARAFDYLKTTCLNAVPPGSIVELQGTDLVVNYSQTAPKAKEEARLETHKRYIDIQIPLSGVEIFGYTPAVNLPASDYDAVADIAFYEGAAGNYFSVKPGMFVIFWPHDGHAPAISDEGVKKIVIKVLV